MVQLGHTGGIGLGLGTLVVQVQTGEIEFADHLLQFLVSVILTPTRR